jgi:hypothetical protein
MGFITGENGSCSQVLPLDQSRVPTMKLFFTLIVAVLALASCKPSTPPASGSPGKPKVALVMKSLANEFFQTMAEGAKKHQAAHAGDYELIVNGIKNETDLAEQVGLVEQMVAQGVQAIVIAPADSKALISVLKRANVGGVLVINIDNKLDADTLKQAGLTAPFVGPDNRAGAKAVGEVLAKKLKAGDEVAIIEGVTTAFNSQQRKAGFEDAMNAAGMKIVSTQSGQWEMEKATWGRQWHPRRESERESPPLRQRQHGPRCRRRRAGRRQGRSGPDRRLRQHRRPQTPPRRRPRPRHRRPARRPARCLRHRSRAEDPQGQIHACRSADAGGCRDQMTKPEWRMTNDE